MLNRYLELRNLPELAQDLGLSVTSATNALNKAGIWKHPSPRSLLTIEEANGGAERIEMLRQKWQALAEFEMENFPTSPSIVMPPVHPAQMLKTVQLYRELQSGPRVADKLKITNSAVCYRIHALGLKMRPPGRNAPSFDQANKPGAIDEVIARLTAEVDGLRLQFSVRSAK